VSEISLPIRYYRFGTDAGVELAEQNFRHVETTWKTATNEAALVLVDVWAEHPYTTHLERGAKITREKIAPVVEACRKAGILVVHAPSPSTAALYPQWTRYAAEKELFGGGGTADPWPPEEFRKRTGKYAHLARPEEPWRKEYDKRVKTRTIMKAIEPRPEDFVISTGEQLHRLLKHKKITILFYAGFAANMCVPFRDYGIRAMHERGYGIILLRDCTTAIEAHDTLNGEWLTKAAILTVEMIFGQTSTSAALIAALGKPGTG
jgi:nicotinamidase-related amidase